MIYSNRLLPILILALAAIPAIASFTKIDAFETDDAGNTGPLIDGVAELNGTYYATDQFKVATVYYTSQDGRNFEERPVPEGVVLRQVHKVSGGLAFYRLDNVAVTTDGVNFQYTDLIPDAFPNINSVVHLGNGVWLLTLNLGHDHRLWRSTDNGASWQPVTAFDSTPENQSRNLLIMAGHQGTAIMVSTNMLTRSTDNGNTWTPLALPFSPVSLWIQQGGTLWMPSETHIYRSDDMGLSWTQVAPFEHPDSFHNLRLKAVGNDGSFFAKGSDGPFYRLSGSGTWQVYFDAQDVGYSFFFADDYFWPAGDFVYATLNEGTRASFVVAELGAQSLQIGPFRNLYEGENGYVWSPWFQWFAPDTLPWVYHYNFGWIYVPADSENSFFFYDLEAGWLYTEPALFPNIYSYEMPGWIYADMRTTSPLYFWKLPEGDYITESEVIPEEEPFDFNALFGKTFRITDSIGTHTITFNNPDAPATDGADMVFNYKGTNYTMSNVTVAFLDLITGPQIVIQAIAVVGDTALGSQVQFGMYPDSQTTGEVRYLGYAIMTGLLPETGGQGVVGRYAPAP
jgi:hypothetical protein